MPTAPSPVTFTGLLETLAVPRGGVLYVQSSADWLGRAGFQAPGVLRTLREWVGPTGLLVMPAYPMRATQIEYLQQRPTYDITKTPAAIGLLPELFRRFPSSRRSLDPDFCVVAEGTGADAAVETDLTETDPFGPRSVYQRLLEQDTTLLGLGVSLNTNSFIHVIDSRLQARYPVPAYDAHEYPATVIDAGGRIYQVMRKAIVPDFQRLIEPSAIAARFTSPSPAFSSAKVGETCFFRWDLRLWATWCLTHASGILDEGGVPCWLRRVGMTTDHRP